METEKPSEPDSTTLERDVRQQFRKDEDVLCLNKKDGCFYLGTIVQVDNIYKKCLVEFLDNTQVWSSFKDLKNFAPQEPEMCYYCEKSQYRDENNSMCTCGREAQNDDSEVNSSTEYYGRGLVKRSTPFPVSEQSSNVDTRFRSHAVRKARRLLNKNLKRKKKTAQTSSVLESQEKKTSKWNYKSFPRTFEEFLELRKKKMEEVEESAREEPQTPEVRKRPQRNLLEARLNSTESKLYNPFNAVDLESKKSKSLIQESSSSSSSNSKRPENSSSKKSKSHKAKSNEKQKSAKPKLVQKTIFDSFNLKSNEKSKFELVPLVSRCKVKDKESDNTSGDSKSNSVKSGRGRRSATSESLDRTTAGSDMVDSSEEETYGRGTLEPFIPTPKDFEGQNHPFRSVTDIINFPPSQVSSVSSTPPITLPLPLKTVISHSEPPRLKKRQLSEEDIIVDRNGQVKRRRHRPRKNTASPGGGGGGEGAPTAATATATTTASKSAQITTPGKAKTDKKTLQPLVNNGEDFALNCRQLRARETLKMVEKQMTSVKPSPTKEATAEDLESSVKYFFGPASRILSGEKYEVRAKRITFDGRVQCIIDWKGMPT